MNTRIAAISCMLLVPMVGTSCSTHQRVKTETVLARALVSDEQMAEIGQEIHRELESQGIRYVKDPQVTGYVDGIASKLFGPARKDRPGVDYHVHVIDAPKTVNAFATPGGHVYLYSGLLLAADNEAEVAGVLAHELGHVTGRHVERALVNAYGVQALAALALGDDPSLAKQMAASVVATGVLRAHSRSEEIEADEYGARYISAVNYEPGAMITFFEKLQARESGSGGPGWLRTHPVTAERIRNLNRYIVDNGLRGTVLGADRHRAIRKELSAA